MSVLGPGIGKIKVYPVNFIPVKNIGDILGIHPDKNKVFKFVCFWKLKKDNSFLDHFKKASYWDALLKNKDQNILITAYNNGFKTVVLPQENIPAFREWLKTRSVMVVATQFNQQTNILPFDNLKFNNQPIGNNPIKIGNQYYGK